jgi:hypothetical protein
VGRADNITRRRDHKLLSQAKIFPWKNLTKIRIQSILHLSRREMFIKRRRRNNPQIIIIPDRIRELSHTEYQKKLVSLVHLRNGLMISFSRSS